MVSNDVASRRGNRCKVIYILKGEKLMEGFDKLVVMELESVNKRLEYQTNINSQLNNQLSKTKKLLNKRNTLTGIIIGVLGYSVYVQASKIEILAREIKELKSEKGEHSLCNREVKIVSMKKRGKRKPPLHLPHQIRQHSFWENPNNYTKFKLW